MTTSEDSASAADDKPPTGNNSNNLNGIRQQPQQNLQQPSTTTTINSQNSLTPTTTTDSTHGSTIFNSISPSGKKTVFFSKPETDTGVALPAETAAEAEAVLQAIAADEKNGDKSESDNEQDDEIVEEGRDGRWSKRKDKVKQRDVPGIDGSFLAMDNETGNEVVWNEVQFSERKNFRNQEEKIRTVFDNLMQLDHVNLVKFFDWWPDTKPEKPRIIFVTEYMSSGSMSKFLQRAKTSETLSNIRMWKKWTIQILSALNYLHSCDPPIAHANLSCNTIFIQQNGLIKIGCVAPNAIHHHVKTFRENIRNLHYIAPEYEYLNEVTPQADIYSFGICALEMATRGNIPSSSSNGTTECTSNHMTQDILTKAIESLENPMQRDFILKCIDPDPKNRPTAKELLFHPVLFEVHSLKLLAAHVIVNSKMIDYLSEDDLRIRDPSHTAFEFRGHIYTYADMEAFHSCKMDLDKFLEDVKNGIYPLIAFAPLAHRPLKLLSQSPSAIILPSTLTPKMADDSSLQTSASAPHVPGQQQQQNNSSTSTNPSNQGNRKNSVDDILGDSSSTNTTETNGTHSKSDNEALTNSSKPSSSDAPSQQQQQLNLPNSTSSPNKLPPYIDTSSATSTITSMTGSLGSPTALEPSSTVSSQGAASSNGGDKPQGETRLIRHMRATIKDQILNILLQLDDYMNRQLTTEVNENDHADELVIELINHGFICQEDSDKVCSLLIKVLEEYREEISRGTGRTVEQEINIDQQQQKQKEEEPEAINAASINNSSSNNRPETLSSNSNTTSTETIIPTIQSPQAPKATPEDLEETSPPPSMTAPTTKQQHQ